MSDDGFSTVYPASVFSSAMKEPLDIWLRETTLRGEGNTLFTYSVGRYDWTPRTPGTTQPAANVQWTQITDNAISIGLGAPVTFSAVIPNGHRVGTVSSPPVDDINNRRILISWQDLTPGKAVSFTSLATDPSGRPDMVAAQRAALSGQQTMAPQVVYMLKAPQHQQQQHQHQQHQQQQQGKWMIAAAAPQSGGQCGSGAQVVLQQMPTQAQQFAIRQAAPMARGGSSCGCTGSSFY